MKCVTFSDRTLLLGDETAELLLEYAAALAGSGQVDTVRLHAISPQGEEVEAGLLLDSATTLMIETTSTATRAPTNPVAERYMKERIERISRSSGTARFTAEDLLNVNRSAWD